MGRKGGGGRGSRAGKAGAGGGMSLLRVDGSPNALAVKEVENVLKSLPKGVVDKLNAHGVKAVVAGTLGDTLPQILHLHPRGWPAGATWENVDGVYDSSKKLAVAASAYTNLAGKMVLSGRPGGVMRHELGHAVDDALGRASRSADFMKAYRADVAKIPTVDHGKYKYYLQPGSAGPSEAFAEIFGHHFGGGSGYQDLRTVFPNTYRVLKKLIK